MKRVKEYLPTKKGELDAWESNFLEKVKTIASELDYKPEEITKITTMVDAHKTAYLLMISRRQDLAQATSDYDVKTEKTIMALRKFAQNIKSKPEYNEAHGSALGIISSLTETGGEEQKPELKVSVEGGTTFIRFKKVGFTGVKLFSKRGDELSFSLLGLYFGSPFKDARPNLVEGKHEKREYYAYYFDKEEQVGRPSDIASVVL